MILRRVLQSPGYFIAATITLALAIAAAGAIIGADGLTAPAPDSLPALRTIPRR